MPDHELLRCVGSGSYGEVWLARNIMGTHRAVKVVYHDSFSDENPYEREFRGMQKFEPISRSHDGFVDILQVGRNDADGYFYYIMELGDDTSTGQVINPELYQAKTLGKELVARGPLPVDECVRIGVSLSAALNHLHRHGLIHRDIKPANIIFVNGIPKVADIGLVTDVGTSHSLVGTEGFMPPEGPGTTEADIYSLGKVLYEISTGHDRKAFPELPTNVDQLDTLGEFRELNEVILRACERDVRNRYATADQMHRDLLLLQTGKSVKRLRLLESRMAVLKKAAIITAVVSIFAGTAIYQKYREVRIARALTQQQVGRNIAYGTHFIDQGDYLGSLPPFVAALRLDRDNPLTRETHRLRIGSILKQCPKLVDMWFLDSEILAATLSRDGRYLLTSGADGTAIFCDLSRKAEPITLVKGTDQLEGAALSRDGRLALTTRIGGVDIWNIAERRLVKTLPLSGKVYHATFSPDATQIVTALEGDSFGSVDLWDVSSGARIKEISRITDGPYKAYMFVNYSPDGTRLVSAGQDSLAQVWDTQSWESVGDPIQHESWVYSGTFSPDGKYILTVSYDQTAKVSDARTGRPILPPLKHPAGVKTAEFSPDGRFIVTAGWDFTVRIWNTSNGELILPLLKQSGKHVMYASFTQNGRQIVTANANGVVSLWDLAPISAAPNESRSVYSQNGDYYATIDRNAVSLRTVISNAPRSVVRTDLPIQQVSLSHDGTRFVIISAPFTDPGRSNRVAQLWESSSGRSLSPRFLLDESTTGAELSADGERLITRVGKVMYLWSSSEGKLLRQFPHSNEVRWFAFSPDRAFLVTISGTNKHPSKPIEWKSPPWLDDIIGNNVHIWDANSGEQKHLFKHQYPVNHAAFSPDMSRLVTCQYDESLFERAAQLWDLKTGQKIGEPLRHGDGVAFASFSPDGKRLLTASEDNTVRLWDGQTGKSILSPLQHPGQLSSACFSPDGRWIATACEGDACARVWDAETCEPLTPPLKHWRTFRYIQFIAKGRAIVTQRSSGESTYWDLSADQHSMEDLNRLAQVLSGHQGDYTGGLLPQRTEELRDAWHKLKEQNPEDFQVSIGDIISWHRREAEVSEKSGKWNAALFHWDRLNEIKQNDPVFQSRRRLAQDRIKP